MPEDQQSADEASTVDRTAAEPLATAAERAAVASRLEDHGHEPAGGDDAAEAEATESADKKDMNAVGDDGQVFGG